MWPLGSRYFSERVPWLIEIMHDFAEAYNEIMHNFAITHIEIMHDFGRSHIEIMRILANCRRGGRLMATGTLASGVRGRTICQ